MTSRTKHGDLIFSFVELLRYESLDMKY